MNTFAGHKKNLYLVSALTAAALCALPFLLPQKQTVYIYAEHHVINAKERGFVNELKRLGYKVKLNEKAFPDKSAVGFWFQKPEFAYELVRSPAEYNFLYSREHYPFDWQGMEKIPVVLTPYMDLYEHYMRSNVKSALFEFEQDDAVKSAKRFDILLKWLQKNTSKPDG